MPADHSKHGFFKDLGDDEWIALDATGRPVAKASDEAAVRRAAPHADKILSGKDANKKTPKPTAPPDPAKATEAVTNDPPVTYEETLIDVEKKHDQGASREANLEKAEEEVAKKDALDHDGDGRKGGSLKGDNATASKSRRQRKPKE